MVFWDLDVRRVNLHRFTELLNIYWYIGNIWTYGPWYHSVTAIKVCSFSYISFREVELLFPVAALFIIFLCFFQISGIYVVILPSSCCILESPKKSEPQSGHPTDPEGILLPEKLSFHLTQPPLLKRVQISFILDATSDPNCT